MAEPKLVLLTNLNKCHYIGFQVLYKTLKGDFKLDTITGLDKVGIKIKDPVCHHRLNLIWNKYVYVIA